MFSTITTAPSTTMPKVKGAQREKIRGDVTKVQGRWTRTTSENGNGQGDDERAPDIAEKQQQNDHHQNEAFAEIVQHGVGGEVH